MSGPTLRRFWSSAEVVPDGPGGDAFLVALDGKPVRLPSGGPLRLARHDLADAIAKEWSQAGGGVVGGSYGPDMLGLTRLAGTMLDRIATGRAHAVDTLCGYVEGEALCYRASHPSSLVARQNASWQPWLAWAERRFGLLLTTTEGVMPVSQPAPAAKTIRDVLDGQDDASLTALGVLVPASGSLILGLAVVEGVLDAATAHALSLLDESFQAEQWGEDAEAAARHAVLLREFVEAERFLMLARPPSCVRLLIAGRVQGVGYRAWLQTEASQAGVGGWARNLADGRVEALLCGSAPLRSRLIEAARRGPRLARVDEIAVSLHPADASTRDFVIKPTVNSSELD